MSAGQGRSGRGGGRPRRGSEPPRRPLPADQPVGSTRTLLRDDESSGLVRRTVLAGGLRVLTEAVPQVRSVTFGVWVAVGSRDEVPSLAGATHYLEHVLFKGTRRRTALEISAAIDAVGGEMNAFTAKEYTCYYARVRDGDLPLAVDVVADLLANATVSAADVENERGVILDEIAMQEDDPGDAVHDLFVEALWPGSALGRPILGTTASVGRLSRSQVLGHYRRRYRAPALVVTAAGHLDHATVVRLVTAAFAGTRPARLPAGQNGTPVPARIGGAPPAVVRGTVRLASRPTEQAHVVLGYPGLARTDSRRFALSVLSTALGGGMSSRLFQQVREERGLAYSVYSYASHYADTGMVGVYAGCLPAKVDAVLRLCRAECAAVAEHGLTAAEVARAKGQLEGSMVLGLEDTGSRMTRLAKAELSFGELPSVDEVLARVDAVTVDDVRAVAEELLAGTPSLAVIGPFDSDARFAGVVG